MPAEDKETIRALGHLRDEVEVELAQKGLNLQDVEDARDEAERFWPVTAERERLARPGLPGRLRALALAPAKAALRPLLRWYVEPALADQRRFNAAVLRMLDELVREARHERPY
jgi:hypothetical protein